MYGTTNESKSTNYDRIVSPYMSAAVAMLGEGYRILNYNEPLKEGDEWFSETFKVWKEEDLNTLQEQKPRVGNEGATKYIYRRKIKSKKLKGLKLIRAALKNFGKIYDDRYMYLKIYDDGSAGIIDKNGTMIVSFNSGRVKRNLRKIAAATSAEEIEGLN